MKIERNHIPILVITLTIEDAKLLQDELKECINEDVKILRSEVTDFINKE